MQTDARNLDYVKSLRLKWVGIALAGVWAIVLVAAVAATIYREIDGPTVRSTISENLELSSINSSLNNDLNSAHDATQAAKEAEQTILRLKLDLLNSKQYEATLQRRLEAYFSSAHLVQLGR